MPITQQGEYVFKYSGDDWVGTTGIIGNVPTYYVFKYSGDVWVGTTGIIGNVPTYYVFKYSGDVWVVPTGIIGNAPTHFRCKYLQCLPIEGNHGTYLSWCVGRQYLGWYNGGALG